MRKIVLAAALVLFGAAPALAQNPCAAMAEASPLQGFYDSWLAAYNSGDAHAMAMLYTDDAAAMYAHNARVEGPMAIVSNFEDAFAAGAVASLHPGDAMVMNDMAFDHGHYVVTMEVEGETVTQSGYWMGVYRMVDGEWKAVRGISNTDTGM
ncbi:MAG: nuclear transport factor 2 family protein [Gemmatimonadota bacterium]